MTNYRNRRKHPRVILRFPVKYREALATPPVFKGAQAKDVSRGGLRFHTETFLPRETTLIIELTVPEKARSVRKSSKVAWSKSTSSGYRYEIGSEFTDVSLSEEDVQALRKALARIEDQ